MKKFALLAAAALILFGLNGYGQDPDTSKIRIGKKKYTIIVNDDKEIKIITEGDSIIQEDIRGKEENEAREIEIEQEPKVNKHRHLKKMDGMWDGFEIGVTDFMNLDYKLALPEGAEFMKLKAPNSMDFSFNFAEKSFGIVKNYIGIVTGFGIRYTNYRFANDFTFVKATDEITADPSDKELVKNRLGIWHLNVPLMMEFQIPVYGENQRIKLSAGVVGGLRIGSRQVQTFTLNDEKQKTKIKDDFYLRTFDYGFTARVGYGDFAFFANYSPLTLFKNCMGPEIYPVTIGIHIGG